MKLSEDLKDAKETEGITEEPKPESEAKGPQKLERADSSEPEKS